MKTKDNGQFPEPFFMQSNYSSGVPTISWEQQRAKDQTSKLTRVKASEDGIHQWDY